MTLTKKRIVFILFGLTFVFTMLIHETLFQTVDTARRYQVTQAITSGAPPIWYVDFVGNHYLKGVNGGQYYWYGMGESVLLAPADFVAWHTLNFLNVENADTKENIRQTIVLNLTFPLLSAMTVAIAFLLLTELSFGLRVSLLGALFFYFGTTFLHYSQIHQENSQLIFLNICGYYMLLKWVKYRRFLFLFIGSALFGTLLLFRITTFADILAAAIFTGLLLFWQEKPVFSRGTIQRFIRFGVTFGGVVGFYFLIDRLFQYKRFGSFTSNYTSVLAEQVNTGEFIYYPDGGYIPPGWPYNLSPLTGITNVLFSPEKSLFIYDPLLIVLGLTLLIRHFGLHAGKLDNFKKAFLISGAASLGIYLAGYSTVDFWGGDDAWGARYHTSPVQLLCLVAVPLFLEIAPRLNIYVKRGIQGLIGLACLFQVCSIIFWYSLEIRQFTCGYGTEFRILQRIINIGQVFTGTYNPPANCVGIYKDNLFFFWPFEGATSIVPPALLPVATFFWLMAVFITIGAFIQFTRFALKARVDEEAQLLIIQPNRKLPEPVQSAG
jgi:hypothetical protein